MPTLIKIIVYPTFALLCLFVFSLLLFPFDGVKDGVSQELEKKLGGDVRISIEDLSPALFSGLTLKEVEIKTVGQDGAAPVHLSKATFKFSILSLLTGSKKVLFDVSVDEGRMRGSFSQGSGEVLLDAKMDGFLVGPLVFFMARSATFAKQFLTNLSGRVNGEVQVNFFPEDPLRSEGIIRLDIPDLKLAETKVLEISLPPVQMAAADRPSRIEIEMSKGNLEVKKIQFGGLDLDLQMKGKVYGARRLDNYRFNLQGSFKLSEGIASQLPFLSFVDKQKSEDGSFPLSITGRVSKPNIRIGEFRLPI